MQAWQPWYKRDIGLHGSKLSSVHYFLLPNAASSIIPYIHVGVSLHVKLICIQAYTYVHVYVYVPIYGHTYHYAFVCECFSEFGLCHNGKSILHADLIGLCSLICAALVAPQLVLSFFN